MISNKQRPPLSVVKQPPTNDGPDLGHLIGEVELAERLRVSRSTLQSWRYSGRGPRYVKAGRLVRYRNADVDAFLEANTRGTS